MRKIFLLVVFVVLILLVTSKNVFASDNFTTSYDVTYTISESGLTHAAFSISLVNKTNDYYASSYSVRVGFKDIQNLTAADADGILAPTIDKSNNQSTLYVPLKKKVVGINNTLAFNVSFDTNDIAQKQGNIWEVNIPGIENQNDFAKFDVHVKTPASFGQPTYIKPALFNKSLDFTKDQLGTGGISLGFGTEQIVSFELRYHLKNAHIFPIKTELALPPSTNYQEVLITDINPKPTNVREDADGNWLAQYSLTPSKKQTVVVKGKARIFLFPKKQEETEHRLASYLNEQPYWQKNDTKIKELTSSLKTPYAIYQYIVKTLTYDFSRVTSSKPRLGGAAALQNPKSAVCLEFTDLFISLARAAGIPAREVNGFAYTQNETQRPLSLVKDVLHAWPEYYDRELQTWIMVDPTWGNTTGGIDYFTSLDFDHFAFVIKGLDSNYPIPAGGYKFEDAESEKDVFVSFEEDFDITTPTVTTNVSLPMEAISGFPISGFVTLSNPGPMLFPKQNITIESSTLIPANSSLHVANIPPFGYEKIPISFEKTTFLTNTKASLTIRIGQNAITKTITLLPLFLTIWSLIGGVFLAIITIIIYFIARDFRHLSLFRQQREDPLRGQSQKP